MIRFFRKYHRTTMWTLAIFAGLLMVSFGMDFRNGGSQKSKSDAAITIGEVKIPHRDFYERKRELEGQYRRMFGPQYAKFKDQLGINLAQNVVDGLIESTLTVEDAKQRGFRASEESTAAMLMKLFPGDYNPSMLKNVGKNPDQLMSEIEDDVIRSEVNNMFDDASKASHREALGMWVTKNTAYDVDVATFDPKQYVDQVAAPSDKEIASYFEDHKEEYRSPPQASYDYVSFAPDLFLKEIEIPQEEIDFYYTDNQSKYETPEQLKLRHIQLLNPKEKDPKKVEELLKKAQEIHAKAKSGEAFEKLVSQYSDDATTKDKGGDLGWVPRGRYSKEFDDKTYAVKNGGLAELITTPYGYDIVKVEGYQERGLKPVSEVSEEIRLLLKKDQAPAIADTKAREFYDLVTASDRPLSELAKEKGYVAASTNGLLIETNDPEPMLQGLSAKVISNADQTQKQLVELKDRSVIAVVKDFKPSQVPTLDIVKDKVLASYKQSQSLVVARGKGDELIKAMTAGKNPSLKDAAKERAVPVETKPSLTMAGNIPPPLNAPSIREAIFEATSYPSSPSHVLIEQGKYYVVQVVSKKAPDVKTAKAEDIESLQEEQSKSLATVAQKAYLAMLKTQTNISVDDKILHGDS